MRRSLKALLCALVFGVSVTGTAMAWSSFDDLALALKNLKYDIIPQSASTLDLGSSAKPFANMYVDTVVAGSVTFSGDVVISKAIGLLDFSGATSGTISSTGSGTVSIADSVDIVESNITYVPVADSTALQTACTAATANDTLILGSGTYTLSTNDLTPGKALTIRGQGEDSTKITFTTGQFIYSASDIKLENLTIDNTANTEATYYMVDCATDALTGLDMTNVKLNLSHGTGTVQVACFNTTFPIAGAWNHVNVTTVSTSAAAFGVRSYYNGTSGTLTIKDSSFSATSTAGSKEASGFYHRLAAGTGTLTVEATNTSFFGDGTANVEAGYNLATGSVYEVLTATNCKFNGSTVDVHVSANSVATLYDCTLVNNTTYGTITYGGTVVASRVSASPDADITSYLGNAAVGYNGVNSDGATFAHYDHNSNLAFALRQQASGQTALNCPSGQEIYLTQDGAEKLKIGITGELSGDPFSDQMAYTSSGKLLEEMTTPICLYNWTTPATTELDQTINTHSLTYQGTMTTADQIHKGFVWALDFDAGDDYLSTPDAADLSFVDEVVTWFGWIEVVDAISYQTIMCKWNLTGIDREWLIHITDTEVLQIQFYDDTNNKLSYRTADAPLAVGWHFVALTHDGTFGAAICNGTKMYVDGVLVASTATNDGSFNKMVAGAATMLIGAYDNGSPTNFWQGDMGQIGIDQSEWDAATVWRVFTKTRGDYNL